MDKTVDAQSDCDNLHTLIIIDDDTEWTELLETYFVGKYRVRVANFATDAIELVRKERPCVIIVDLVMPSMDGFGIIHRLRASSQERIPTILLTGWKTQEVEECAATMGCAAVVSKPVSLVALDELVSSLVSSSTIATATVH